MGERALSSQCFDARILWQCKRSCASRVLVCCQLPQDAKVDTGTSCSYALAVLWAFCGNQPMFCCAQLCMLPAHEARLRLQLSSLHRCLEASMRRAKEFVLPMR